MKSAPLRMSKAPSLGPHSLPAKGLSLFLILSVLGSSLSCSDDPIVRDDPSVEAFLNDTSGPPEPKPIDEAMRQKADVIALPAISVTVWAIGALMVYIGSQTVFQNTIEDFETVLDMALGRSADWSWAEETNEVSLQAEHLTRSLNRIAYRSEGSDFYSINGNDYLRFLSMVSPITILNPKKLKDLLDGKVRPWDVYAKEFFAALQVASVKARHLTVDDTARGLCARATVMSIQEPRTPYVGMARSRGSVDIIPAIILASLKATVRCGLYDTDVREFLYGYFNVRGPMDSLPNIFISHMLKTAKLLFKYADTCQMPPRIQIDLDGGDCHDVTLH